MIRITANVEFKVELKPDYRVQGEDPADPIIKSLHYAAHMGAKHFTALMYVDGNRIWELDVEDPHSGRTSLLADMQRQALGRGINLTGLLGAFARELRCSDDAALVLALQIVFPLFLVLDRVRLRWAGRRGVGPPNVADDLTLWIWKLADAWQRFAQARAGSGERAVFVRVVEAAMPYLPLRRRRDRREIAQVRELVRREFKKLRSNDVEWIRPPSAIGH